MIFHLLLLETGESYDFSAKFTDNLWSISTRNGNWKSVEEKIFFHRMGVLCWSGWSIFPSSLVIKMGKRNDPVEICLSLSCTRNIFRQFVNENVKFQLNLLNPRQWFSSPFLMSLEVPAAIDLNQKWWMKFGLISSKNLS